MSDLQCAATLLIARHAAAEHDTDRVGRELAGRLRHARVSMIYTSGQARAVQTAEIVAAELGVVVRVRDELLDVSVDDVAAGRVTGELEDIADLHRGETVLVVSHTGTVSLDHRDVIEVAIDADGCVVRAWAGEDRRDRG